MTRQFNSEFHCPNCKTWHTSETMFGRWIRNNKELDSIKGYCVTDQDYWVHKFKTYGSRDFQLIMGVEIKTMGRQPTLAQKDTLHILNQLLRNRRLTPTKELKWQADRSSIRTVKSIQSKRDVTVKSFGIHLLVFSGLGPDDSSLIMWDKDQISTEILTSLLRFDLDPDTLKPLDLRNHHSQSKSTQLSLFAGKEA